MQRILIPTDFSENSRNAINYGLELFKKTKCIFHIIHINPIPPYSGAGSSVKGTSILLRETVLTESKKDLKKLLNYIEEHHKNELHSYVSMAKYDFFVDSIKRAVEDKKIDLIIMGTKGATGLKKVSMGSNTGDVITRVKCPLLAVPENSTYKTPKEIAFPTDFHIAYDIKVLDNLVEMATMNNSILRVVHISKKGEMLSEEQLSNKDFLHDYLRGIDHSFHSLTGSKLETSIQCFVESRDIDLVAMVAKNLNFFQRILFRPAVEEISYHTDIPFLVLHE
ncbi:universal stress protein [uncultured Eudoraea sp.]|uniref:universal stress protein n=1 Tax=uncultured Eudoraea sp. TaxID=1035614 RepID=UPI0026361452|nr:universal stress protein [uncultured Eudoraea sp.]